MTSGNSQADVIVASGRSFAFRDFERRHGQQLVKLWRQSFEAAVGVVDPNPISDQLNYLLTEVLPEHRVKVVWDGQRLAGFIAANEQSISQLYLDSGYQRLGIGGELVNWAKAESDGSLWLYTFEANPGARAFYLKHDFVEVRRGFEPAWQLADIKLLWRAEGQRKS